MRTGWEVSGGFGVESSGPCYYSPLTSGVWDGGSCSQVPSGGQTHPRRLHACTPPGASARAEPRDNTGTLGHRAAAGGEGHKPGSHPFCALCGTHMVRTHPEPLTLRRVQTPCGRPLTSPSAVSAGAGDRAGREASTGQGPPHPLHPLGSVLRPKVGRGGEGGGAHWAFRPSK